MLLIAALMTVLVSAMHSVLGGKRLIAPILRMEGLPIILGSLNNTRLTLLVGWHITTLTWLGLAAMLVYLHVTPDHAGRAFLWMVAAIFMIGGVAALILTRGAHLSWVLFLPIAAITGYAAFTG